MLFCLLRSLKGVKELTKSNISAVKPRGNHGSSVGHKPPNGCNARALAAQGSCEGLCRMGPRVGKGLCFVCYNQYQSPRNSNKKYQAICTEKASNKLPTSATSSLWRYTQPQAFTEFPQGNHDMRIIQASVFECWIISVVSSITAELEKCKCSVFGLRSTQSQKDSGTGGGGRLCMLCVLNIPRNTKEGHQTLWLS